MRLKTTGRRITSSPFSIRGTLLVTTALALTLACLNFAPGVLNSSLRLTHLNHDAHREELGEQGQGARPPGLARGSSGGGGGRPAVAE